MFLVLVCYYGYVVWMFKLWRDWIDMRRFGHIKMREVEDLAAAFSGPAVSGPAVSGPAFLGPAFLGPAFSGSTADRILPPDAGLVHTAAGLPDTTVSHEVEPNLLAIFNSLNSQLQTLTGELAGATMERTEAEKRIREMLGRFVGLLRDTDFDPGVINLLRRCTLTAAKYRWPEQEARRLWEQAVVSRQEGE